MSPDLPTEALWLLTGAAAFAAGVLNAIAGGGRFLTFPALVFAGVPPLAANATKIDFLIEGKKVILVDDVLFITPDTARALSLVSGQIACVAPLLQAEQGRVAA